MPTKHIPPADLDETDDIDQVRMPFGEHLEELRGCLIRAFVGVGLGTIVSLIFAKRILIFILTPVVVVLRAHGERSELLAMSPHAPFLLYLKVGFLSGIVLTTPWVVYQIWVFVAAGLYPRERKFVKRFMPLGALLFALGVVFMFYIVLPIVLNFFVQFSQSISLPDPKLNAFQRLLLNQPEETPPPPDMPLDVTIPLVHHDPEKPPVGTAWINTTHWTLRFQTPDGVMAIPLKPVERLGSVSSLYGLQFFVSFVFSLALGFGLAFELPILVILLAVTQIVPTAAMARARRYVILGIVVAAAVLTPPDVISQILLAVPMLGLFEVGLIVARSLEHRQS